MSMSELLEWVAQNSETAAIFIATLSTLIAAITALFALLSATASFCANSQTAKQYKESIQPQLSMSLTKCNSYLYLKIKNSGKLPAKEIKVVLKHLSSNGSIDQFDADPIFSETFELYPEEIIQGKVAIYGGSLTEQAFPKISIDISYKSGNKKKMCAYSRTVTYLDGYTETVFADVKMDMSQRDDSLDTIKRAAVRVANYLDGRQVASFDKVDILAGVSLRRDLMVVSGCKEETALTREDTLLEALGHKEQRQEHAKQA